MDSVNVVWECLTADSRRWVCDTLSTYIGTDVHAKFAELLNSAHRKQIAAWAAAGSKDLVFGKRKWDGGDVAQHPSKKTKLDDQSIFSSATLRASKIVAPSFPAIASTTGREKPTNPPANPASSTATSAFPFGQPLPVKTETPANPPSDCDENFTIDDRISSGALRNKVPGATPSNLPSAQNASSAQAPAASPTAPPQGTLGSAAVSTVYKPPFTGVDISTLKVPANSNVNLTMNVFQAPSSLHQNMGSGEPRKLKCIQCKEFYIETQNTAMECRRHTGMRFYFHIMCPRKGIDSLLTFAFRPLSRRRGREV